jgi:hypothetical protein
MPLCAIINGKETISIDVPESEWKELKKKRKKSEVSITLIDCGSPAHPVTRNGMQFFRHNPNTHCAYCEHESEEHIRLKIEIINHCRSLGWDVKPEANFFEGVWRPDVLAWKGNKKIAFEVQLSPISLETLKDRDRVRKASQVDTYWLIRYYPNGTQKYSEKCIGLKEVWGETRNEEIGFFNPDGIQTIKISQDLDIKVWVFTVLSGEYNRMLLEGVNKIKTYNTVQQRIKNLYPQLEIFKCKIDSYKWELKNRFTTRFEKDKDHPELDKKIDAINRIWDAYESFQKSLFILELNLKNPKIYENSSKIDDIFHSLKNVQNDDEDYQKSVTDFRWLQVGEKEQIFRDTTQRIIKTQVPVPDNIEKEARDAIAKRDKEYSLMFSKGKKQWYIPYQNPNVKKKIE